MSSEPNTALIVIDAQVALLEDEAPYQAEEVISVIADLVIRARQSGVPVVFVRHKEAGSEVLAPGYPGFEVHPAFAPLASETVIDKVACDSFCDTPLAGVLQELGVERLVLAGMQTEMCVDTASRSALHRGFDVVLAGDGHSTWDSKTLTAAQIIEHHNATLANVPHPTRSITVRNGADIEF